MHSVRNNRSLAEFLPALGTIACRSSVCPFLLILGRAAPASTNKASALHHRPNQSMLVRVPAAGGDTERHSLPDAEPRHFVFPYVERVIYARDFLLFAATLTASFVSAESHSHRHPRHVARTPTP